MASGISVVIPNYNGVSLFPDTLPTVMVALENSGLPFEIIIADDASVDGSIAFLGAHFPQVRIIRNEKNSGFSITANRGVKAARYNLVLLLNSDVKLEPSYFPPLLKYFQHSDTFGVMGRIIGWDDPAIQDGAKWPSFHQAKIKTSVNYLLAKESEMENGLYTMYLSGANCLVSKEKFEMLGGFNEMFSPFYVEDYELSLRAWRVGLKCYYEHFSVCRHKTSTTIQSASKKSFIRMITNRNKWYTHAIHLDAGKKLVWQVQLLPEILLQSILMKPYYPKAFVQFLKNRRQVKASKEKLLQVAGKNKLLSVEEVARFIKESVRDKEKVFF